MSTKSRPDYKVLVWGHGGHDSQLRHEFIKLLETNTSSQNQREGFVELELQVDGCELLVSDLAGDVNVGGDDLRRMANSDRALIIIDAARGVDDIIAKQMALLSCAGVGQAFAVIISGDGAQLDKTVTTSIAVGFEEIAKLSGIEKVKIVPLNGTELQSDNPLEFIQLLFGDFTTSLIELKTSDFRMSVDRCMDTPETMIEGRVLSGVVQPRSEIVGLPSSKRARLKRITRDGDDLTKAVQGDQVVLFIDEELSIAPGHLIAAADGRPEVADQVRAKLYWSSAVPMLPGRPYIIELAGQTATASVTGIRFKQSYAGMEQIAAKRLHEGELGEVNLSFDKELAFDAFDKRLETGIFRLLDKTSSEELGTGFIKYGLRRATNIHRQAIDIDRAARAQAKGQQPCCIWFTGLSGSGKSAVANALEKRLFEMGRHTYLLDGDNVRHGLNRDLGFTDADRVENIRRIGEVAKLMVDSGLIVMTAFISPFRSERRMARKLFGDGQFIEVFVDTPLEICEARDPKGLYKKARAGEIKNFTGIDSSYEAPEGAELSIHAGDRTIEQLVDEIVGELEARDMLIG